MTTPEEAREMAVWIARKLGYSGVANDIQDLANQVERLEAQKKQLREALEDMLDAEPGYEWGGYSQSEMDARQKAATILMKATQ